MSLFYEINKNPHKKMKYETKFINFRLGYFNEKDNNIQILSNDKLELFNTENTENINQYKPQYKPILYFQSVDCADIYIIANMIQNNIDINKGYTLDEIFTSFINNKFHIGSIQHYNNKDQYTIKNIKKLEDDDNSEIKLHYTTSKKNPNNIAWRTITWDLFEEYVPQNMQDFFQ